MLTGNAGASPGVTPPFKALVWLIVFCAAAGTAMPSKAARTNMTCLLADDRCFIKGLLSKVCDSNRGAYQKAATSRGERAFARVPQRGRRTVWVQIRRSREGRVRAGRLA